MFAVSQTKVASWLRCKLQYHNANVRKLKPRREARPLYFGSAVHVMLEAIAEGKDPVAALARIANRDEVLFREERDMYLRLIDDVSFIMRAYQKFWASQPLKYIPISGKKAELEFSLPIDDGIVLKGRIDGLVKDRQQNWLLENKTHEQIPNDDHRWRNLQSAVYLVALAKLGWPKLEGMLWNYIRSKSPSRPELLKAGILSSRSIDSLPEVILDAIEEHKLNPKQHEMLIQVQEQNLHTWFQRVHTTVQPEVVWRLWAEFTAHARAMADYYAQTDEPPPRTIDLHCNWCPFEKLCRAELQGLDVDFVLEREYVETGRTK